MGARRFGHLEVFASIAAGSFAAARFLPVLSLPFECPFLAWVGLPCASCGMTRAFVHLAHGAVAAAWEASPLGALFAAGAWIFAAVAAIRFALNLPLPKMPAPGRWLPASALAAVLVNWVYLVVR
jgi:hypothetical protein